MNILLQCLTNSWHSGPTSRSVILTGSDPSNTLTTLSTWTGRVVSSTKDGEMLQFTRLQQVLCFQRNRFTSSTTLHTTTSHSPIAQPARRQDWPWNVTAIPRIISIGRDILVGHMGFPPMVQTLIKHAGTSRFFDINGMEKPEGYENQQD